MPEDEQAAYSKWAKLGDVFGRVLDAIGLKKAAVATLIEVKRKRWVTVRQSDARVAQAVERVRVKAASRVQAELQKVQLQRYGSHTAGRPDWERKWDETPGKRVLLYALSDYSGSFFKWAEAINRHTGYAARLAVFDIHKYGYETDLVMPFPDVIPRSDIQGLAREADIIHIKDESGFFTGKNNLAADLLTGVGKPLIYTAYGGYMRKFAADESFRRYVGGFDDRIAMTPDLNYDWFDGHFIPHAIDTDSYGYSWNDGRLLAHSPSTAERKGTEDLVAAIAGLDVQFDLIQGVQHTECMRRKRVSNLFFDQAGNEIERRLGISTVIGWYGNSALEAAVFGIPTIAHLSQHAFDGARRAGRDIERQCAIINTPRGAEGIRQTIQRYFDMTTEERRDLSLKTRQWMEDFHSYQACGRELARVYDRVLARRGLATASLTSGTPMSETAKLQSA